MDPVEIINKFNRMKIIWIAVTILHLIILFLLIGLMDTLEGNARTYSVFGGVGLVMSWSAYTLVNYHCPRCGTIPFQFEGHGGVIANPDSCNSCGAEFKIENL